MWGGPPGPPPRSAQVPWTRRRGKLARTGRRPVPQDGALPGNHSDAVRLAVSRSHRGMRRPGLRRGTSRRGGCPRPRSPAPATRLRPAPSWRELYRPAVESPASGQSRAARRFHGRPDSLARPGSRVRGTRERASARNPGVGGKRLRRRSASLPENPVSSAYWSQSDSTVPIITVAHALCVTCRHSCRHRRAQLAFHRPEACAHRPEACAIPQAGGLCHQSRPMK